MMVIFLLPLLLSSFGTIMFFVVSDISWFWKGLAAALTVTSIILQFGVEGIHFFIPLSMQLVVSFWTIIYWKLES